jgi:hypothetical protein
MALAIDASSPNRAQGAVSTTTITTNSFTPPNNSLLVACWSGDTASGVGANPTVSNSGTALSWTGRVQADANTITGAAGQSAIDTAWLTTSRSLTVTVSASSNLVTISLKVYVITGADPTTWIGGTNLDGYTSTGPNVTTATLTSQSASSLMVVAATDWKANGDPVSSDLTVDSFTTAGAISGTSGYKFLSSTGGQTANLDAGGTLNAQWTWAAMEILPAASAPVYRSSAFATGISTVVLPVPSGTVSGDQLIAVISCAGNQTVSSVPSGWTLTRVDNQGTTSTDIKQYVYTKLATGSEPASYTWSL